MNIVEPSYEMLSHTINIEQLIEQCGRVCYKSEANIDEDSYIKFIEHIKSNHHESVLEHNAITVKIVCDRGVSHELVRHRLASYSQESTRYCNYTKGKFNRSITVVDIASGFKYDLTKPMDIKKYNIWKSAIMMAESHYFELIALGATPQEARSVLPNSLKTEIIVTANVREWRHILKMRTSDSAHPQIREVMQPILANFKLRWFTLFGDL